MWPNFFIVGAAKAGTTSLYQYLKQIPGIYMSPVKEPHYFSRRVIPDDHHYRPIRDKEKYLSLFKKVNNEKVVGEASPTYLRDPEAPRLIHQVSPNARILISLRDPIERPFPITMPFCPMGSTISTTRLFINWLGQITSYVAMTQPSPIF